MTKVQKQVQEEAQTMQSEPMSSEEVVNWKERFSNLSIDYKNMCDKYNKLFALYAELLDKYLK